MLISRCARRDTRRGCHNIPKILRIDQNQSASGLRKHVIILNLQKNSKKNPKEFTLSDLGFFGVFSVFQLLQIWVFFGVFQFSNFFRFGFFLGFFRFPTISVKMIRFAKSRKIFQVERFRDFVWGFFLGFLDLGFFFGVFFLTTES